jgi:hypothetical protein
VTERDYTKFIGDEKRLNMRLIPRPVWVQMVEHAQQQDAMIEQVLDEMYWLWDLRQLEERARSEGRTATCPELLQELMSEMSDRDWWKLTSAFEEYIMREFHSDPAYWARFLDPVYDAQERDGWKHLQ